MIGSRDDDGIDSGLLIKQLAIVVIRLGVGQSFRLERAVSLPLIDIANGNDLLIDLVEFRNQVTAHLPAHPDAGKRQPLIGRCPGQDARRQNRRKTNTRRCGGLNETTSRDVVGHREIIFLAW